MPFKLKPNVPCSAIMNYEECEDRNDCKNEYIMDIRGGFNSCVEYSEVEIGWHNLCQKTGGVWSKKIDECDCRKKQTEKEIEENGKYFLHVRKGCITPKADCLQEGGKWDRWTWTQKNDCVPSCYLCYNECRNYTIDEKKGYSCLQN